MTEIPEQCPFAQDIIDLAEKLYSKANQSQFPKEFIGGHLYGIANGYLVLESWHEKSLSEQAIAKLNERIEALKTKATTGIREQLDILAAAGITDNDSAFAYLSKAAIEIENWEKIKAKFDSQKMTELEDLKNNFVELMGVMKMILLIALGIYLLSCILIGIAVRSKIPPRKLDESELFLIVLISLFWPVAIIIEKKDKARVKKEREILEKSD